LEPGPGRLCSTLASRSTLAHALQPANAGHSNRKEEVTMRKLAGSLVASLAVFAIAKGADAHSFICEKTVNGQSTVEVSAFPATLHFEFNVINNHPSLPSTYSSASDPAFAGFAFEPAAPYEVPFGQSVKDELHVIVENIDQCRALAAADGIADNLFVNTFTVTWHGGQASCSASVTCAEPPPPPPPPPPEGGATRTPGFYKTHVAALEMCLADGAIELGFVSIETVEEALGLLWSTPSKFADSSMPRSSLDRARFILGRHTLVGVCNQRLFGTEPSPSDLLDQAVAALAGQSCTLMLELAKDVDDFNNSGDDEPFPDGFEPGPAAPKKAAEMATDPTTPSGQTCAG
jgi:methionine-rich copper-binding protein CopC